MRLRPSAALSIAAVSALLLAGCGSETEPDSAAGTGDLCAAAAESGPSSESVTVDGEAGVPATATFETPLEPEALEVTVIEKGDGDPVEAGEFVSYAMTAYDAATGDELATIGYEPGELLPQQMSADTIHGQVFGCSPIGTRVVATFPASETAAAEVYVLDLLAAVPTAAWGEEQDAVAGMPEVALGEDGAPEITIPEGDAPTETTVAVLKKGDGYEVASGDAPLIQYKGVRWSTGETFDATWDGGTPISYPTTNYVPGFQKALEGQTVGSQVLVVIPPAEGYGEGELNEEDLKGETLVFVVDILGAQAALTP